LQVVVVVVTGHLQALHTPAVEVVLVDLEHQLEQVAQGQAQNHLFQLL
jgi:hypothetical protein